MVKLLCFQNNFGVFETSRCIILENHLHALVSIFQIYVHTI